MTKNYRQSYFSEIGRTNHRSFFVQSLLEPSVGSVIPSRSTRSRAYHKRAPHCAYAVGIALGDPGGTFLHSPAWTHSTAWRLVESGRSAARVRSTVRGTHSNTSQSQTSRPSGRYVSLVRSSLKLPVRLSLRESHLEAVQSLLDLGRFNDVHLAAHGLRQSRNCIAGLLPLTRPPNLR